jgi:acyl-CoA reductase-like NAD-dependent aldehyde dehydrogenase
METEKFFIAGEFKSSVSDEYFDVRNPYTGNVVRRISKADRDDFNTALNYLTTAFEKFRKEPVYMRVELLRKIAQKIDERSESLAQLLTLETGKPIKYSRIEVQRAVLTFTLGSEEASRINGEVIDLSRIKGSERVAGIIKRFPVGVILAITPWNFPINLVAHKLAPALASGNTVLLKPASASAACGIEIMKIIIEACDELKLGFYPVNIVTAPGNVTEEFASDDRVKLVSFTGSSAVGWHLKRNLNRQRISLELGGNAGVIVDETANINDAVAKIVTGAFSQAGQSCISVQRIFVHKNIYENFLESFIGETEKLKVGDPFEDDTDVASMITVDEAKRAETWIQDALDEGAKAVTGGKREKAVLLPTILCNTNKNMNVNSREVFAPVATVSKFGEFGEAVEMVNDSLYGLQAGVFTNNMANAFYAFENIETGGVIINNVSTYRMDAMPYGGVKDSGNAREGVRFAIEEMTERKIMVVGG